MARDDQGATAPPPAGAGDVYLGQPIMLEVDQACPIGQPTPVTIRAPSPLLIESYGWGFLAADYSGPALNAMVTEVSAGATVLYKAESRSSATTVFPVPVALALGPVGIRPLPQYYRGLRRLVFVAQNEEVTFQVIVAAGGQVEAAIQCYISTYRCTPEWVAWRRSLGLDP